MKNLPRETYPARVTARDENGFKVTLVNATDVGMARDAIERRDYAELGYTRITVEVLTDHGWQGVDQRERRPFATVEAWDSIKRVWYPIGNPHKGTGAEERAERDLAAFARDPVYGAKRLRVVSVGLVYTPEVG